MLLGIFFSMLHVNKDEKTELVGLDLLVDVKQSDLVHDGQLGNEVDDCHHQVDRERERRVVRVMCTQQEPMLINGKERDTVEE